jgi:anti-anti-sigma factor
MTFTASLSLDGDSAAISLEGELDASTAPKFHEKVAEAVENNVARLEIYAGRLTYISSAGLRSLLYAQQKMGTGSTIALIGATGPVASVIRTAGLDRSIRMSDR